MLSEDRAGAVADAFDLGPGALLDGPAARGQLGQVWQLTTADGRFAVKEWLAGVDPDAIEADAAFATRARDLHGAYVEAGGPGRVTRRGHFTMLVAAQAHIGQLACARWVGAVEDEPRRALLADSFDEIVQDPVTLGRIDGILAALG